MMRTSYGPSHHPPDDERESRGHGGERRAEQPQRAVEYRPGLHQGLERQRPARDAIGKRLLPDDDVAAPYPVARVLGRDLARQMEAVRHELTAGPRAPAAA